MENYVLLVAGFALLILGAEALVHGAVAVATRLRVSPLLIGVTVVAYGTSTPELLVSVNASLSGNFGIAVGNVVGSNIFNILFILGLTSLITPINASVRAVGRDGLFALAAAGLFIWVVQRSQAVPAVGFNEGVLFLSVLLAMILFTYGQERGRVEASDDASRFAKSEVLTHSPLIDLGLIAVGFGLLIVGADMLVHSSVAIARANGVSEAVIGLTVVAAGTSLPELVTSVVAALRRKPDIALGNIVGSNIYNILAILGVASLINPVQVDREIIRVDMWVMLAATVALFLPMLVGRRMGRSYGLFLLLGYGAYLAYLFHNAGVIHLPMLGR
ncbi:MAG: calcium/sodium antiporter [Alphaproteobacteria bacterium]|nr:calcium/sodium antiporter [Alphaproteobacteria bacterium]